MARKKFDVVVEGDSILDNTKGEGFVDGILNDIENEKKEEKTEAAVAVVVPAEDAKVVATSSATKKEVVKKEPSKKEMQKQAKEADADDFAKSLMQSNSRELRDKRITILAKQSVAEKFQHYVDATGSRNGNEFFEYLMLNLDKILKL